MSGLFASEEEIMALWDNGKSRDEIVQLTGKSRSYVESIIGRYNITERTFRAEERMVIEGSKMLLAAIARHHPEKITAGGKAHA